MVATAEAPTASLTEYEAQQVEQIAAWKASHPSVLAEMFHLAAQPVARVVEWVLPDPLVRKALEAGYRTAERTAWHEDIARRAGVAEPAELRNRPLEECDRLAKQVGLSAQALGTVEGALTGAGGAFTTLLDIPILFGLAIRTIVRIGRCYGYALDQPTDRAFVLGTFAAALSNSRERKQEILFRLREIEDLLLEETQENLVVEEAASLLFQIEVFESVPGIGAISGGLLNQATLHRVDRTARHIFQERRLREDGKVDIIEPAADPGRVPSSGRWHGVLSRGLYAGSYYVGYGLALPRHLFRRTEAEPAVR